MNIQISHQIYPYKCYKFIFNHIINKSITNMIEIITDQNDFPTKNTLEIWIKYISNKEYNHNVGYSNSRNCYMSIANDRFILNNTSYLISEYEPYLLEFLTLMLNKIY